ncbi:MAG: RES domain-containing protein [Gemmatimonadetes bacterium]|nr:RES domain-containing protein [Gemmatimonadota bacterium]
MLIAWRIVKSRHAAAAFDGEGARLFGGRWNSPGVPAVYTSESRALALLEVLTGLGDAKRLDSYLLIPAHIPDTSVVQLDRRNLPANWDAYPPPAATQSVGDRWIKEQQSAALRVPSVLVPAEWNYVLNPRHPDFGSIVVGPPEPLLLDPRLIG